MVRDVEQAASLEAACSGLRLDIELPGALRWVGRRVHAVHASLNLLKGLLPDLFATCTATLTAFGEHLAVAQVLPGLRQIAAVLLHRLPAPLGFAPRRIPGDGSDGARQHRAGADPPPLPA